jgi:hypothetical protein
MPGVEEMTVRLVGPAKRRVWWSFWGFTVVWGGIWGAATVSSLRAGELSKSLIPIGIFLVVWLPVTLFIARLAIGNTRIGPAGLTLRGMLLTRVIAWDEVTEVKDRFHQGRRGGWWTVEAQLANGRVQRLPGFYCEGPTPDKHSRPERDAEFENQLAELHRRFRRWQNA